MNVTLETQWQRHKALRFFAYIAKGTEADKNSLVPPLGGKKSSEYKSLHTIIAVGCWLFLGLRNKMAFPFLAFVICWAWQPEMEKVGHLVWKDPWEGRNLDPAPSYRSHSCWTLRKRSFFSSVALSASALDATVLGFQALPGRWMRGLPCSRFLSLGNWNTLGFLLRSGNLLRGSSSALAPTNLERWNLHFFGFVWKWGKKVNEYAWSKKRVPWVNMWSVIQGKASTCIF